jgi:hypothetical protein
MSVDSQTILGRYHSHTLDEENMYENYDSITRPHGETIELEDEVDQPDFEEKKMSIDDYLMGVNASPLSAKVYDESILSSLLEFELEDAFELGEKETIHALKQQSVKNNEIVDNISNVIANIPDISEYESDDTAHHYTINMPFSNGSCAIKHDAFHVEFDEEFLGEDMAVVTVNNETVQDTTALVVKYSIPNTPDFFANPLSAVTLQDAQAHIKLPFGNAFRPKISKQPRNGSVQLENGLLTYTPNEDFVGIDDFTYQLGEVRGDESNPTTVVIKVIDRNATSALSPRVYHHFNTSRFGSHKIYDESSFVDLTELREQTVKEERKRKLLLKKAEKEAQVKLEILKVQSQHPILDSISINEVSQNQEIIEINSVIEPIVSQDIQPRQNIDTKLSSLKTLPQLTVSTQEIGEIQTLLQFNSQQINVRFISQSGNVHYGDYIFELSKTKDFSDIVNTQLITCNELCIGSFIDATFRNVPRGQWYWRVRSLNVTPPFVKPSPQNLDTISIPCVLFNSQDGDFVASPVESQQIKLQYKDIENDIITDSNGMLLIPDYGDNVSLHIDQHTNIYFFDGKQPTKSISFHTSTPPDEMVIISL